MAAQKKTIIKYRFLGVMGDSRGEGVNVLVIIEHRNRHGIEMRGLPGEGFLHFKAADVQFWRFGQAREHCGVDGMNVQHRIGLREQAINQRM